MNSSGLIYGIVACGGKSTRMGRDKARIRYHGEEQRVYVYRMLTKFCDRVFISCRDEQRGGLPQDIEVLADDTRYSDRGPLVVALTAALKYPGKNFLVIGCDYPMMDEKELSGFVQRVGGHPDCAAFFNPDAGVFEPLLAYYSGEALRDIRALTEEGTVSSLRGFLEMKNAVKYHPADTGVLLNADTPEIEKRAREKLQVNGAQISK